MRITAEAEAARKRTAHEEERILTRERRQAEVDTEVSDAKSALTNFWLLATSKRNADGKKRKNRH